MSAPEDTVRTVFAPSPIGPPNLGLIRTAVFNWALARHHGGQFVVRFEDTDTALVRQEFYAPLLEILDWLGLDHDEGPTRGGPHGPYLQSQRREIHLDVARRLLEAGELYESFSTPDEVTAREAARGVRSGRRYDNGDRRLTDAQRAAMRAEGRRPSLRLRMPDDVITCSDLVRGDIEFDATGLTDPVLVRSNGEPTFNLANPVDDAMMGITHNFRGEDLLSSAPRQLAVYAALQRIGVARTVPLLGHLAMMRDADGDVLRARNVPQANMLYFPEHGWAPEAVVNYLSTIGWSHPDGTAHYSRAELASRFDVSRVSARSARLDVKRLASFNTWHLRAMDDPTYLAALRPYLDRVRPSRPTTTSAEDDVLLRLVPALRGQTRTLVDAATAASAFLDLVEEGPSGCPSPPPDQEQRTALEVVAAALDSAPTWSVPEVAAHVKQALGAAGIGPGTAFGALGVLLAGEGADDDTVAQVRTVLVDGLVSLGRSRAVAALGGARP